VPVQHPDAQRDAGQRLCRPGGRLIPPGAADEPRGKGAGPTAAEGVRYAYRWIEPPGNAAPVDDYVFLDAEEHELGRSSQVTTYDPRPRFWYRQAAERGQLYISEPDVFAVLDLIGFTVAAPFYADGKVAGVAAADITMDGLSEYLAARRISP